MRQYLDLLRHVMDNGHVQGSRAKLADGSKPKTISLFAPSSMRFDLRDGFPLVTTKHISFKAIAAELLWFLSGSTNVRELEAQGVTIWSPWADEDGELGPIYGALWRHWRGHRNWETDQIYALQSNIKSVAADPEFPAARRLILTSWDPSALVHQNGPAGCHSMAQWYVYDGKLSCRMYQRSCDLFLGCPYNTASYALLTHLLAKVAGLEAHEFIHTFGDAHCYLNHVDQVREQLTRAPLPLPRLILDDGIDSLDGLTLGQMRVEGYQHHPRLRGEVAV